jgi:hypothetical protein
MRWDIAPCSLVGVDRHFRGAYCLHNPDGGDYTHYSPKGSHLHTRRRENLQFHIIGTMFNWNNIVTTNEH